MPNIEQPTREERAQILVTQGWPAYQKLLTPEHYLTLCDGMARASKTPGFLPDTEPEETWRRTLRRRKQGKE